MSETLNLGQIRSQVEGFLMNTSTDANSLSWPVSEINAYINEAVFYTQQMTKWYEQFSNVVCTASTSTYTGPANAYQYTRITWDRVFLPQTNNYELDRDDPSWRLAGVNNPFRFHFGPWSQTVPIVPYPTPSQNGITYAPFSQETGVVTQFLLDDGITPDPAYTFSQETGVVTGFTDTTGSIIVFHSDNPFVSAELGELIEYSTDELNLGLAYVAIPDTLVNDTDTPQLPVLCHFALVCYAVMRCFYREGEFQDLDLAQAWFMAYADWMESVLENRGRWWPTRVKSLEPYEDGSLFAQRLNAIGFPLQLDLKPSYGS